MSYFSGESRRTREDEDDGYRGYSGRRDLYPPAQPYEQSYSSPPYHQSSPPPPKSQAGPVYSPPTDKPPIPDGWVPQWDDHYQRWFYHDTATGRSQWEAPGYVPPRPPMPGAGDRSAEEGGRGAHAAYGGDGGYGDHKKTKGGHGGMLLGAAGGLAAGALIASALHDDDDDYRSYSQGAPAYAGSVDSSDRESLEEARRDYAEALDDARSSSASGSDREGLEEAREEYYSEEEEAYGSD